MVNRGGNGFVDMETPDGEDIAMGCILNRTNEDEPKTPLHPAFDTDPVTCF